MKTTKKQQIYVSIASIPAIVMDKIPSGSGKHANKLVQPSRVVNLHSKK